MTPAIDIHRYRTLIFDCDGVILNSNPIKTDAFYQAALPYGEAAASALRQYHIQRGGISRYEKFEYFLRSIIGVDITKHELDALLERYQERVLAALGSCEIADGLGELREATPNAKWMVASGGDQAELRAVFRERHLAAYFDGGIFGSPTSKVNILERELAAARINLPALLLGDSAYDREAAQHIGSDFVFVNAWTELKEWPSLQQEHGFPVIAELKDLLERIN
jgi:phosphoglycolate phosphatase-like HAD superfamily hydrolase